MAADQALSTSKSERTRESILDAARTAFAQKGFSGVTIRDITDLAQVTRANFYYYFPGKTELFIELGTATYRQAIDIVDSFTDIGDPTTRDGIREWLLRYFDYLDRNGAFVMRSSVDMPADEAFRALVTRSHRHTAAALGRHLHARCAHTPEVDPAATGQVVMAMLERCWQMDRHNEIGPIVVGAMETAATEFVFRLTRWS